MSDFDTVLERLLAEPAFAAALAADPGAALAGYRLDADEVALLHSQLTGDTGGHSAVEVRANQSSLFGMLSPLAGVVQVPGLGGAGAGLATAAQHLGPGGPPVGGEVRPPVAAVEGFGPVAATEGFGPVAAVQGFGTAVPAQGFGTADSSGPRGSEGFGAAPPATAPADPPDGYHTRVDVDGDGRWDAHILRGTAGGGVDILVDLDRDGSADFVGHDRDADGLVDSADYDVDHDGRFDRRAVDRDGDGWLDATVVAPAEDSVRSRRGWPDGD